VRFYRDGSPAVLIRSFDTGAAINIARRLIRPFDDGTKILTLDLGNVLGLGDDVVGTLSTCGSLVGHVADATWNGCGIALLTEGVTDSLAAVLAFCGCTIVGANGWRMMPRVAAAIAPRLVAARGWLLVAVDDDEQGVVGAGDAMRAAADAGLVLGDSVRAVEIGAHHDLADAWRAGWRWTWPELHRSGGAA
jgi:hypothetical protein